MAIHIFLSDPLEKQVEFYKRNVRPLDKVFHLPYVVLPETIDQRSTPVSGSSIGVIEQIRKLYDRQVTISSNKTRQQDAYLDIFGMYSIRYFYALKEIISQNINQKFFLYSAKGSKILPLLGIKTSESRHGSRTALGAGIASILLSDFPNQKISIIERRSDLIGWRYVRLLTLVTTEFLFSMNFIFKRWLMRVKLGSPRNKLSKDKDVREYICVVRVPHHVNFLGELAKSLDGHLNVVPLPQARQGNPDEFLTALKKLDRRDNVFIDSSSMSEILVSGISGILYHFIYLLEFIRAKYRVSKKFIDNESWHTENALREPLLQVSDSVYKMALSASFSRLAKRSSNFISFAMKGRYALFEADAARKANLMSFCIQTAALDGFPSPIFPAFDIFYASSPGTRTILENVGSRALGQIKYAGAPLAVSPFIAKDRIESIAFFTQPYDQASSCRFLEGLMELCRNAGIRLKIKLHPRDSLQCYKSAESEISRLEWLGTASELIESSDLTLARTSSVLFEGFALGKPSLAVHLSVFDREFSTDYLEMMKQEGLVVKNIQAVEGFIEDADGLNKRSVSVRKRLGLDMDMNSLASDLSHEAQS